MSRRGRSSKTSERALSRAEGRLLIPRDSPSHSGGQPEPEVSRMVDRSRRLLIAVSAAVAMAGASVAAALHAQASVPPTTAPGWTLNFSDDFNGSAGSGVDGNWRYTTGTSYPGGPANFGTGEVETMNRSTQNVSLDGTGNLRITALNNGGAWTSGRVETNREDLQPPAGGKLWVEARIQLPN